MDNFLKTRRLELSLTLEDVGNHCGVGKSTVRKWENGMINDMGRSKIQKLSEILQVSPIDILCIGDDTPSKNLKQTKHNCDFILSPLEEKIIIEYRKSDEIGKAAVLRMLCIEEKGDETKMA